MQKVEQALGRAVFQLWSELPRDIQEKIFNSATSGPQDRHALAVLLHDHHPKTSYPPFTGKL
jgi:hypothetical protein